MSWKPTIATLFLLLVFGPPLFSMLLSLLVTIGQQLGTGAKTINSIKPVLPSEVSNSTEYNIYKTQESKLEKILDYIITILSNKYALAALIAAGIIYTTFEYHSRRSSSPL